MLMQLVACNRICYVGSVVRFTEFSEFDSDSEQIDVGPDGVVAPGYSSQAENGYGVR